MKNDSGKESVARKIYIDNLEKELERITIEEYKPEDSNKNHQTFAKALLILLQRSTP